MPLRPPTSQLRFKMLNVLASNQQAPSIFQRFEALTLYKASYSLSGNASDANSSACEIQSSAVPSNKLVDIASYL